MLDQIEYIFKSRIVCLLKNTAHIEKMEGIFFDDFGDKEIVDM